MRIRNNIGALNAHRQLGINNKQGANAKEKLSSGLRINRAGDDAAGLAISEKMRGQIRGLSQANRNAQDGISLIQTAEGALGEVHSILQRVRELANQAATDTNTLTDRKEIQKEINQLLDEIDRIADNTEFNAKKLLDGSMSASGLDPDALAALEGRAAIGSTVIGSNKAASATLTDEIGGENVSITITGGEGESYNGFLIRFETGATQTSDENAEYSEGLMTVTLQENEPYTAGEINEIIAGATGTPDDLDPSEIKVAFNNAGALTGENIAGFNPGDISDGGYFELDGGSSETKLAISAGKENGARGNDLEIAFVRGKQNEGDEGAAWDISGKKLTVTLDRNKYSYNSEDIENLIRKATAPADLNLNMDAFRVKGKGIIEVYKLDQSVSVTLGGGIDATKGSKDPSTGGDAAAAKGGGGLSAAAGGTVIHIGANQGQNLTVHINSMKTSALGRATVSTEAADPAGAAGTSTQPADIIEAKAATGTATIGGVEFTISAGRDNGALANDVEIVIAKGTNSSVGATWKDNTLTILLYDPSFSSYSAEDVQSMFSNDENAPLGLYIDLFRMTGEGTFKAIALPSDGVTFTLEGGVTGNDERDDFGDYADSDAGAASSIASLKVSAATVAAVNTDKDAAALANPGVLTQEGADSAISSVNDAIEQVSAERSKLGAIQNRLEHTISNLGTAAENLRASESRIRDLDMAEEVMEFTKSNILSQAATTMLAQANLAPQTVLQLLG